ncbi:MULTISPECIES: alpha/beta fold hydrolase [Streptomyces]|uniref:Alpha/beta hydrolase n=2 Tax=Streptomyces auratus AGR0001 TaxID=1160718 RepID=A0A8B1NGT6_9ACTN|nr:alpha/beta hydrolase [Streptomyces auratus]QTZ93324.1 alpha/beta hydrolase [Streptomyces auratus AGR0001]
MASLERHFAVGIAGLAGASLLTGAVTRFTGKRERARRYLMHERPDGSLVEIAVHIPPQAKRAVLFDNGMGAPQEYWDWVCNALPADMGYVRFNRPGLGLSTSNTQYGLEPHFELLQELRDTYIADLPVVLAGHSLGGYFLAAYAAQHPDAAKGVTQVVMIDATEVVSLRHSRRTEVDRWSHQRMLMEQVFAATGLSVFRPAMNTNQQYRPDINRSYRAFLANPRTWAKAYREYRDAMTYPELTSLDCPLTVITAENNIGDNTLHAGIQARLAVISDRARHHFVDGADHESILAVQPHAEEVAELIAGEPPSEGLGQSWQPSTTGRRTTEGAVERAEELA